MQPKNPLLFPRMIWQIALTVTALLVVLRIVLYIYSRKKRIEEPLATHTGVENPEQHASSEHAPSQMDAPREKSDA